MGNSTLTELSGLSAGLVVLARAVALDTTRNGPDGHHGDATLEGEEQAEGEGEAERVRAEAVHTPP